MIAGLRLFLLLAATSAALLSWSELIFVNADPIRKILSPDWAKHLFELWALYLIPAAALLALWRLRWPVRWWQAVLSGAIIGWIIEGALITAVYESPPLSFFWTSMAWHATVDVAFGLWLLPRLLRGQGGVAFLIVIMLAGVVAGLWALWTLGTADEALNLSPSTYAWVMAVGAGGALVGMLAWAAWADLLNRLPKPLAWGVLAANAALFTLQGLVAPILLAALLLLVAPVAWLVFRPKNQPPESADFSPIRGIWFTLFPILAVAFYAGASRFSPSIDVEIITFSGFALGMIIVIAALFRGFIRR